MYAPPLAIDEGSTSQRRCSAADEFSTIVAVRTVKSVAASGLPSVSWIPDVNEKRYVSPGTSVPVGVHVAFVGLGRVIVPSTVAFALSAWTVNDDAVTPDTASEKVIVNGPLSEPSVADGWFEMVGTDPSVVQLWPISSESPDRFVTVTVNSCLASARGPQLTGVPGEHGGRASPSRRQA